VNAEKQITTHKLLLGTHTSGNEANYLMVADVSLPNADVVIDARKYDDDKKEVVS
jgi:histone-binding protein RBBP4